MPKSTNTRNAVAASLRERQTRVFRRIAEQVERVCSSCGEFGYSPCQNLSGTRWHSDWCKGMHVIGVGHQWFCYKCANDVYSRNVRL